MLDDFKDLFTPPIDISELAVKIEPPAYEDTRLKEMADDIKKPIYELTELYKKTQKRSSVVSWITLAVAVLTLIATIIGILLNIC